MMTRIQATTASLILASVFGAACRKEPAVPPAQAETSSTRPANAPMTVTGCLRAGDAEKTYVLTTAQSVDGTPAATYHLTGTAGTNLQDHIGKRVEVTGVVNQQSQIATQQPSQPAGSATGTTGSQPTVQTGTQLSIQRLDVTTVKRTAGECQL